MSAAESGSERRRGSQDSNVGLGSGVDSGDGKVERDSSGAPIDTTRLMHLFRDLQRIAYLQVQATAAEIEARQKNREIKFKRRAIWASDDRFMREVQTLSAREGFQGFEKLKELARQCQLARDNIGELEEEGNQAENHWEGQIWELHEAENNIYHEYQAEFQDAEGYSSTSGSEVSSHNRSSGSDEDLEISTTPFQSYGNQVYRTGFGATSSEVTEYGPALVQDPMLLGLTEPLPDSDLDFGLGDLEIDDQEWRPGDLIGPRQIAPSQPCSSIEAHTELLTNFGTRRDRVTKWILHAAIISRHEANLLKNKLDKEIPTIPSNWAQLVIAYWESDDANRPVTQEPAKLASSPHENRPLNMKLWVDIPTDSAAQKQYNTTTSRSPKSSITGHPYIHDLAAHSSPQTEPHPPSRELLSAPFKSPTSSSNFQPLHKNSLTSSSQRSLPMIPSRSGPDDGDQDQESRKDPSQSQPP
ncbi:hypothetical protein B7494_g8546 [Chlorociboria aeruginascens]|nr:hypothetical protein B7494_g8546 [Chlorociboria aeruginascens]